MKQRIVHILSVLLFPAVLFYYETILRVFTEGSLLQSGTWIMVAGALVLGLLFYLATSLFSPKVNRRLAAFFAVLLAIPFGAEYFIYRQFKMFYDINTSLGGATDAMTGFQSEVVRLLFCWDGLSKIALLLLPALLILVLGKRLGFPAKSGWRLRLGALLLALLCLGLGCLGISQNEQLSLTAGLHYNFQSAVTSMGLVPGLSLDIKNSLLDSEPESFEQVQIPVIPPSTTPPATTGSDAPQGTTGPLPTEPPVVYVPNAMDIDFSKLTTDGRLGDLNSYVAAQTPTMTNEYTGLFQGKNLILITAEAFCHAAIDPELTPTLYRMSTQGMQFTNYYQPSGAGTTGGEYQVIFGMVPTESGMSFKRTAKHCNYFTLGNQFNRLGYWGRAYHNNDYTYYDRHETHINLGYSQGFLGYGNGMEEYLTNAQPRSDVEMFQGSISDYIDNQPFHVYYMTVSGHSGYTRGGNAMVRRHWDRVKDLDYSELVRGYLASQLELEDSMTFLISQLEEKGIADDTVIVITGDHFPYGLENDDGRDYLSELYGYRVNHRLLRDQNALIIWSGCLEDMEPIVVDEPTFSLDILPTLSNLFGLEFDSRLFPGRDVFSDAEPLVFNSSYDWITSYGTYRNGKFIPVSKDVTVPEGYVSAVSATVRNKVRYCEGVLDMDYFGYLYEQGQLE